MLRGKKHGNFFFVLSTFSIIFRISETGSLLTPDEVYTHLKTSFEFEIKRLRVNFNRELNRQEIAIENRLEETKKEISEAIENRLEDLKKEIISETLAKSKENVRQNSDGHTGQILNSAALSRLTKHKVIMDKALVNEKRYLRDTVGRLEKRLINVEQTILNIGEGTMYSVTKGQKGERGFSGLQGLEGPKGMKGDVGDTGPPGIPGPRGFPGVPGIPGRNGLKGEKGESSMKGNMYSVTKGQKGERGFPGLQGQKGPKGKIGDFGKTGPPGMPGPQGFPGVPGIPGRNGLKGEKGESSMKASWKGEKGDVGHPGATGPSGMKGSKGEKGLKGETGYKGSVGTKGEKGSPETRKPNVYFHVAVSTNHTLPQKQVIKFDHVFSNQGDGYDSTTGVFTAPYSGVYLFLFFVEVGSGKYDIAYVQLHTKGIYRAYAIEQAGFEGQNTMAGNAYVTYLYAGDKAWIQTGRLKNVDNHKLKDEGTTFTGILIY